MHLSTLLWSLCLLFTSIMSHPQDNQASLQPSTGAPDSMAHLTHRQTVPGDSPAVYISDPSNDLLSIDALDLLPNPPVDRMTLRLKGNLISEVGSKPRINITASLNGTVGPGFESDLCDRSEFKIMQNGTKVRSLNTGPVEISYRAIIPYWGLKKGNYTVHTEMYATNGSRMTGFEGTVWVNGEAPGGDGWAREGIELWETMF